MKTILFGVAVASLLFSSAIRAQSLAGSDVSLSGHCCTAPVEDDRITQTVTSVVDSGIEFPLGSLVGIGSSNIIPVVIDVGDTSITFDYTSGANATPGTFNGYAFMFTGAPAITGVAVNAASTFDPITIWSTDSAIFVNVAGLQLTSSSLLVLDVALAVPEPAGPAMLLTGLGLLGLYTHVRRRARSITST